MAVGARSQNLLNGARLAADASSASADSRQESSHCIHCIGRI